MNNVFFLLPEGGILDLSLSIHRISLIYLFKIFRIKINFLDYNYMGKSKNVDFSFASHHLHREGKTDHDNVT